MPLARKLAFASGFAWLVVAVAFSVFLVNMGLDSFAGPEGERTRSLMATIIVPGYLINFAIIWMSRRGRLARTIDERDKAIERRATEVTGILTLLTVFLVSIAIYDANVAQGSAPVGWFFIIAYGTIVWVSLLHPVLTLCIDYSGIVDG